MIGFSQAYRSHLIGLIKGYWYHLMVHPWLLITSGRIHSGILIYSLKGLGQEYWYSFIEFIHRYWYPLMRLIKSTMKSSNRNKMVIKITIRFELFQELFNYRISVHEINVCHFIQHASVSFFYFLQHFCLLFPCMACKWRKVCIILGCSSAERRPSRLSRRKLNANT